MTQDELDKRETGELGWLLVIIPAFLGAAALMFGSLS